MLKEIFGGKCPSCGGFSPLGDPLCEICMEQVSTFTIFCSRCEFPLTKAGQKCPKCHGNLCRKIKRVYSLYPYNGPLRDMVLDIKFKYNIRSALNFKKLIRLPAFEQPYDGVFCVPSHFLRKFVRFFHPAQIFGEYVSTTLSLPLGSGLRRVKNSEFQHKLKSHERSLNVKDIFVYDGGIKYKNVLLVDDILTTGATLEACAAALKRGGVKRVDCFVFAVRSLG